MTRAYAMLVYPASVLRSPDAEVGTLCGADEAGRPYEVMEVEQTEGDRVFVYLQYATQENLNRQIPKLHSIISGGTLATGIQA